MADNPQAIAKALPQLIHAEQQLAEKAAAHGITYSIAEFGGVRTEADTTKILKWREQEYPAYVKQIRDAGKTPLAIEKWRPIAPFGNSYHNFGAAFDVRITKKPAGMTTDAALALLGSLAPSCGLKWGHAFGDDPHFELSGPIGTWRSAWAEMGKQPGVGAAPITVVGVLAIAGLLLLGLMRK